MGIISSLLKVRKELQKDFQRLGHWKNGLIDAEIARQCGVSREAIRQWRVKNNLESNGYANNEDRRILKDQARMKLYRSGFTDRQIAGRVNVAPATIRSWRWIRELRANRR